MQPSLARRTLLRTPAARRPRLRAQPRTCLYHSYERAEPAPYRDAESRILSSALTHVPAHGFTHASLVLGAQDAGYLDISTNLFPKGAYELVLYHLVTQRLALRHRVHFPEHPQLGVGRKIRALVISRLHANADTGVLPHWPAAAAHMSLAENMPSALTELARLADEMWFLAGDTSVDASWYTKRATLSAVYAATELFHTTDQSTDFTDTADFLDRRLEEVRVLGSAVRGTMEWLGFQAGGVVNLLRSKGVRI